jgi:CRP-like cAMP-binding protein/Fe-S-cluster-containing hydrogenase component 2
MEHSAAPAHAQKPPDIAGSAARISIERLKACPLFSKLPDSTLSKLQLHVREVTFEAGATILRAGAYNTEAHYLADGVVEVRFPETAAKAAVKPSPAKAVDRGMLSRLAGMLGMPRGAPASGGLQRAHASLNLNDGATIVLSDMPVDLKTSRAVLEKGDLFGEMSAISRYPVSTDVVAVTDATCLLISSYALTTLLFKQAALADFKKQVQERYRTRTLTTHLRQVSLFADLDDDLIRRIMQNAELIEFDPDDLLRLKGDQREEAKKKVMGGVRIVEQNTPGDALYVVVGGHVKMAVRAGAADLAVTYLRKGDFAGELCLLMDEPWPFSLYALEHVEIVKITRADVEAVLAASPAAQRRLWETAVKRLKQRGFALKNPQTSRQIQMAMDTGLIHGESVLLIDLGTCTRCDDCVRACADTHGGTPRFIREGLRYERWNVVTACYQCTDPVCMVSCPTGAITRGLGTLEVTINDEICVGCEACAKSCPWDNITMVPNRAPADFIRNYSANKNRIVLEHEGGSTGQHYSAAEMDAWSAAPGKYINLATKCDLCVGRAAGPACVQMCPHGSAVRISFKDLETVAETLGR